MSTNKIMLYILSIKENIVKVNCAKYTPLSLDVTLDGGKPSTWKMFIGCHSGLC